MSTENISFGASLLATGLLLYAVCVPLLKDRIKPNHFYGVRLPKSYESTENWYKMNRYGARQMMNGALAMMACGVLAFFLPIHDHETRTFLLSILPLIILAIPTFQIFRYSKTI